MLARWATVALACWLAAVGVMAQASAAVSPGATGSRPDPEGVPTRVTLGLFFVDLISIDDPAQEFVADVFAVLQWRDPRMASPDLAESGGERLLTAEEVWVPSLSVLNRRSLERVLPEVVRVDSEGLVTLEQRYIGRFATRLDLREYPSDSQTLPIRIVSYRLGIDELELVIDPRSGGRLEEASVTGWQVELADWSVEAFRPPGAERERPSATFRVLAKRETGYHLLTTALPLLLIALMAWSVFWIDPAFLPAQVGVSTASIFTLIAFRFSIKLTLPPVSYLTSADWYVLAITLLVFGAFGHAIYTGRMAKSGREELAHRADRWGRWIYLATLSSVVAFALV